MPVLRGVLRGLHRQGLLLGILSNAQFYTPLLFECFLGAGAREMGFREELILYSCELGLAKPSSRLFEIARERLAAAGVRQPRRSWWAMMPCGTWPRPGRPASRPRCSRETPARCAGRSRPGRRPWWFTSLAQLPRLLAGGRLPTRRPPGRPGPR